MSTPSATSPGMLAIQAIATRVVGACSAGTVIQLPSQVFTANIAMPHASTTCRSGVLTVQ
jgi:hypothetical protein